jgi:hypothetical protein
MPLLGRALRFELVAEHRTDLRRLRVDRRRPAVSVVRSFSSRESIGI